METYFTYSRVLKKRRGKVEPSVQMPNETAASRESGHKTKRQPSVLARLRLASASQNADL